MAASRNPTDGGLRPITPQEGLALFDAALAQPAAVVYVARERAELPHAQATPPPLPADTGPPNLPMLIRTEVARLLGVAPEALPLDKSLAELGFDSLLGVELRDVLSRRLSIHVPGSLLLDQPNIAALAATLAQRVQREPQPAGAPLGITRLHPESPYPPLYMVGGAVGGDELYLRALAEALGPLQSCHCLHYPGLLAEEEPLDEVTALAKLFVSRLQAFQPSGPYALAGHSLGGIIAFEMAILLTRAGQSVVELILLDAPLLSGADGGASLLPSSLREYLETLKRTNWVTPELAEVFDKGLASSRGPLLERLWRANVTAMRNYRPTSMYHGDATFITPASPRHGLADYISAWKAVCPALKVGRTSGTHITMVRAPHATKTARIIRGLFADPDEPDYQ